MKVWILAAECGDYYCGCADYALNAGVGSHLIGIYTSEALAREALGKAEEAEHVYELHSEPRRTHRTWGSVDIAEVETDVMPAAMEVRS